jgi:hypothetical protein
MLGRMNTSSSCRWSLGGTLALVLAGVTVLVTSRSAGAPVPDKPEAKRTPLAKNVFLEVQGEQRRVIVQATVCLREGQLEGLLCRKNTKEHEYILEADADARQIHLALVAAKARPGKPVQFDPKYVPASGSAIKVRLRWEKDGKTVTEPAQEWIRDSQTKKPLAQDWVFGGSMLVPNPEDQGAPPIYLANQGDVVCVCNMDTAMLDLPIPSPKRLEDRVFHAETARIPALGTKVEVIFEPVPEKEKDKEK